LANSDNSAAEIALKLKVETLTKELARYKRQNKALKEKNRRCVKKITSVESLLETVRQKCHIQDDIFH